MNERDNQIDIIVVAKRVISRKKLLLKVSLATFAVACIIIFPVPRYYTSSVVLAPEIGDIMGKNSLSSLASSFGFNLGNSSTGDAIYPDLYPALINTNDFAINLTQCKVKSKDGSVNTTYYDYLLKHQKPYLLAVPFDWLKNLPQKLFGKKGLCILVFGDQKQACGVLIDTMDKQRFGSFPLFVLLISEMKGKSIQKSTRVVAIARVNHHR